MPYENISLYFNGLRVHGWALARGDYRFHTCYQTSCIEKSVSKFISHAPCGESNFAIYRFPHHLLDEMPLFGQQSF
jgi:hypothetical protein